MPRYNQDKLYEQVDEIDSCIEEAENQFGACIERMNDAKYYFDDVLFQLNEAKKKLQELEDEINEEESD